MIVSDNGGRFAASGQLFEGNVRVNFHCSIGRILAQIRRTTNNPGTEVIQGEVHAKLSRLLEPSRPACLVREPNALFFGKPSS